MIQESLAREVLAKAVATGGDFAEIFLEDRVNHNLQIRSSKIDAVSTGRLHGAGVRVFDGTRAIYVYTNDTSREGLLDCAETAAATGFPGSAMNQQICSPPTRPNEKGFPGRMLT